MSGFDLLTAVQPSGGWFSVVGIKDGSVKQHMVETREEVSIVVDQLVAAERNVFFGVAKFKSDVGRTKDNVQSIKAFWLDIDCGEEKAAANERTGRPSGYANQEEAIKALRAFCTLVGLPKPIIVNSGRGLHCYWPLEEEITREQWEPVGERLRELCVRHEFHVDPAVFEVARILRVPGTYNFKDNPPPQVTVLSEASPTSFAKFREILGVEETEPKPARRPLSALALAMRGNEVSRFSKIMQLGEAGCQQLNDCYQNQEDLPEPRWFDALSIAQFCEDRDTAIHKLSDKHPGYDFDNTQEKARHSKGPHTCDQFERNNPGGCDGCPHIGKFKSPIVLGRIILKARANERVEVENGNGETETLTIPEYPDPFFRAASGGVWRRKETDEDEDFMVLEYTFYVVKRMRDPNIGEAVVFKLHMPCDGIKEFSVASSVLADKTNFRSELAKHGILIGNKRFDVLTEYIYAWNRKLQFDKKAENMRMQFGWADDDSKFIVGDKEFTTDGPLHSPPSAVTQQLAGFTQTEGTLEKWKEVFALYGRPGLEPHAFAALTAFGSPLLKFLGQRGALINLVNSRSGQGKTTVLHMCNSVWGKPDSLCLVKEDTVNAKVARVGIMNNLPPTFDEMTNTRPEDLSALIYSISQGRGKDRMKQSSNELRHNSTTWQCIALCSSNSSFYEKLAALKASPDGEMMRLLEYKIDHTTAIDAAVAKDMFDHQLMENYGHAGHLYAQWLVNNAEEAKTTALAIQAKIDKELKLTQRERFWSAVMAANFTGGLIAKQYLGLIDWDMKKLYDWATNMIKEMRKDVLPPATNFVGILGDFLNRHIQNTLVVNDTVDARTKMPMLPTSEPKGELIIRQEPDTRRMFIAVKAFKKDCVEYQVNYRETLRWLEAEGVVLDTVVKRMSKGMKVSTPGVYAFVLDMDHPEFAGMHLPPAEEAASEAGGS